MDAIVVDHLRRRFGDLHAIDDLSFAVGRGELFAFLGPNGAGKTTTIRILCTLLAPTSGTASVNGFDVTAEPDRVRRSIGLVFQDVTLDESLTGLENLRFYSLLYGIRGRDFEARARALLELVGLAERAQDRVSIYSGGMKRRLEIARGLIHAPAVLFLDEPTLGLDTQTRRHIWNYLQDLRAREEATVFVTTHYIEEAENCDRVAVIDRGRLVALDTPSALKGMFGGDVVVLETSDNARAASLLEAALGLAARRGPEGHLLFETRHGDELIPRLLATLNAATEPVVVTSAGLRRPTLEDAFIKLTGRAIRELAEGSAAPG